MNSIIQTVSGRESAELASLQGERNPELRAEGLLHLAGRLEIRGREAEAAAFYQSLIEESSPAADRARERLAVLQGGGHLGGQVERLSRHFLVQATDPALLFGMGFAGSVATVARLGLMSRFAMAPASWATRGWAA